MNAVSAFSLLIVVPTLNSFKELPTLIGSLRDQSWSNWKLLFVDGPSEIRHRDWLVQCCAIDSRCSWVEQSIDQPGIFGAMNQGFSLADPEDWVLFWGSDDWAAAPSVLEDAIRFIAKEKNIYDLFICTGRYADASTGLLGRTTVFQTEGVLNCSQFRRALWFGASPPHQATWFGPGARAKLDHYASGFRLAADLDYFLQLSRHPGLCVSCFDLELVHMADGGVSGKQTKRRLLEVRRAYRRAFPWCWLFPYAFRYIKRISSLLRPF